MSKVVLYARTSTFEKQDPEMQLRELREYAARRGWNIVGVYEDRGFTGTNNNRPQLKQLLKDAKARKFDLVAVWKLDRWGRSLREIVLMLQELQDVGVDFFSLQDSLDLSTSQGRFQMHLLAAFSQFEADTIKARVRAGLELARARGKRLGRPKLRDDASIMRMSQEGLSVRAIAKRLGLSKSTVQTSLASVRQSLPKFTP